MLDLFEINDSFEDLFDFSDFNSEEAQILQNSEEDLSYLDIFFELLIVIDQNQSSTTPHSSLIRFCNQLKNNQFKDAIQIIRDNPHCLQQMNNSLPVTELILFFLFTLRKRLFPIIKSMWENNTLLGSYFSGKPISVQVTNAQGTLETQTWQLTMPELIANFKAALASHSIVVIKSMWENENSPLQNKVKKLDDTKLTELTEKVLSSSKTGKSEFITIFLNFISNRRILEACLDKRIVKKQSLYVKNQAASLNNRLKSIDTHSVPSSINHHIQSYNSNAENGENGENGETTLIDNPALSQNNFEDNEPNAFLDEMIADEITAHSYSTPLLNNSMFNKNKRPHQTSSSTQNKFQRKNPDDDGLIDLIDELLADDDESNYLTA